MMYKKIRNQPSTLVIYVNQLIQEGVLRNEEFQEEKDNFTSSVNAVKELVKSIK